MDTDEAAMEAIGRLAAALAHGINNYVCAITGQCELVKRNSSKSDRLAEKMDLVIATAGKLAALSRQLAVLGREPSVPPERADLEQVIEGVRHGRREPQAFFIPPE